MPRLPIPGADEDQWGKILNAFLDVGHRPDGTLRGTIPATNVKDFGARGDGIEDDGHAIQLALDSAQRAGGGTVFFPLGEYRVSAPLQVTSSNVVLRGTGNGSVIKACVSAGTVIKIGHAADLMQCTNAQVIDLTIDRGAAPDLGSCGISIERARYVQVSRVHVHNQGLGIAVGVPGEMGIPTQFVHIEECYVTGGNFPDACLRLDSGADYAVSRCFFEPSNRGIVLTGNSNGVFVLQTTVINGNAFNYGVVCEGTGFARNLIGLNIENALRQQILIGGEPGNKRIVISDSWLGAGDDQGPTREGILIQPGIENVLISNCRIGDQRTFGIETQGSYVKIAGNLMENNGWGGILVNGGTNILAQSNIIRGANVGIRVSGTSDYYIISHNLLNDAAIASDGATGTHKIVDSNL